MPSGSRRRKAAKKKKGTDTNNNKSSSTLHTTENDDLRNQEERDSDGGENEVVSPLSEGNNQDQFPEEGGNEFEKTEDVPSVRSVASESISLEGDTVDSKEVHIVEFDSEGNGILEENVKEMNPEDVPESGSVDVACGESVEVLTNGYHDEHNGIDLDGEPRFDVESELVKPESAILEAPESGDSTVEKVIHDVAEVAPSETLVDSGLDLIKENEETELKPRDYSSKIAQNVLDVSSEVEEDVESVVAVSEEVVHVNKPIPDETILDSASALKENEEKELQTGVYSSQVPQTLLDNSSNVEEYILSDSVPIVEPCLDKAESIPLVAEKVIHVPQTLLDNTSNVEEYILSDSVPIVEPCLDKAELIPLVAEKVIHVPETAPVETVVNSGSDLKENGDEVVVPVESSIGSDKAAISEKVIYVNGTAPTENVDKELLTGDCSAQTPDILLDISSKVQESDSSLSAKAIEKEEDRSLPISDCSTVRASSSVESSKEPESSEISENQPLIATAPRQVEKTKWFGCCGIFDLISGTR